MLQPHDLVPHFEVTDLRGERVADRWGEVVHVAHPAQAQDLPAADEIADWVQWLRHRCPECEGEAR